MPSDPVPGPPATPSPVTLLGRRGRARGTVRWRNDGSEPLAARSRVVGMRALDPAGRPVAEVHVAGAVHPGAEGTLELSLELDPATPAGQYPGRVVLGHRELEVNVVVPARHALRLTPRKFYLEAGTPAELTLVIENRGTVPVTLRNPPPSPLEPTGRVCTITRATFAKAALKPGATLETLAAAFVESSARSLGSDTFVGGTLEGAPLVVAPGEQRALTLKLRIPNNLKQERHQGTLELGPGARVKVEVRGFEPNGGST